MHTSGTIGFSLHADQKFFTSRDRRTDNTTVADPSRSANEDDDEDDERDDEMSELTQMTRAEKRKEFQTDETANESRTTLPLTDSSHANLLRPSDKTQKQPERS